jgi:tetratricopeptide (TPR) repeat protein
LKVNFEKALDALESGDRRNALKLLTKLAESKEGVLPEHKHVFAGFGSDLRKQKLPAAALQHQLRVVELSPKDDHALFNVARVYYDMGDYGNTIRYLNRAIAVNENLKSAQRFLEYVRSEGRAAK